MKYVLVWIIMTGSGQSFGSAECDTYAACLAARKEIHDEASTATVRGVPSPFIASECMNQITEESS
jgi:hypothetical protein